MMMKKRRRMTRDSLARSEKETLLFVTNCDCLVVVYRFTSCLVTFEAPFLSRSIRLVRVTVQYPSFFTVAVKTTDCRQEVDEIRFILRCHRGICISHSLPPGGSHIDCQKQLVCIWICRCRCKFQEQGQFQYLRCLSIVLLVELRERTGTVRFVVKVQTRLSG